MLTILTTFRESRDKFPAFSVFLVSRAVALGVGAVFHYIYFNSEYKRVVVVASHGNAHKLNHLLREWGQAFSFVFI